MTFYLLYRDLPLKSDGAPWWLKQGRKEGQRTQQGDLQFPEQPEASSPLLKPRLGPDNLWALQGRLSPCTLAADWGRPVSWGPAAWHLWLGGHNQGSFVRTRTGVRPAIQIPFSNTWPGKRLWALTKECSRNLLLLLSSQRWICQIAT